MLVRDGRCDVNVEEGLPLVLAVLSGIPEMVAIMLSCDRTNPLLRNGIALKTAIACREEEIANMLLSARIITH